MQAQSVRAAGVHCLQVGCVSEAHANARAGVQADDVPGREQQAQRPSAGKADAELDVPPERIKRRKTADSRHVVARTKHVDEENAQGELWPLAHDNESGWPSTGDAWLRSRSCCAGEQRQAHRKAGSRIPYVADDSDEEAAKAAARYARMRCNWYTLPC